MHEFSLHLAEFSWAGIARPLGSVKPMGLQGL